MSRATGDARAILWCAPVEGQNAWKVDHAEGVSNGLHERDQDRELAQTKNDASVKVEENNTKVQNHLHSTVAESGARKRTKGGNDATHALPWRKCC